MTAFLRRFITGFQDRQRFARAFIEVGFEVLDLRIDLLNFGPFRSVNNEERVALFNQLGNPLPQHVDAL